MPITNRTFTPEHNYTQEYAQGQTKIRADLIDDNFDDIASVINDFLDILLRSNGRFLTQNDVINTHYTTRIVVGSQNATANTATTNGNTYLRLFDDTINRNNIRLIGSGATSVTSDDNGVITISSTDTNTVYTHPTTAGNKHIPAGGSSGQILRWSSNGTAVWGADNNTTYSVATTSANGLMSSADKAKLDGITASADAVSFSQMQTSGVELGTITINGVATKVYCPNFTSATYSVMRGCTAGVAGEAGLVPAPAAGKQNAYLRGDGVWAVPPDTNTTYSVFVGSGSSAAAGLVPKPPTYAGNTRYLREDGTWTVPPDTNTTYVAFVKSGSSAAAGLVPRPSTTAGTTRYLREDATWQVPPTPAAGTAAPIIAGTATVGTSSKYAREDHIHPKQTSVTGSAGSAATLTTARTITIKDSDQSHTGTGASFNGSANITLLLPGTITAALNGNAATATKLKDARYIWGRSFNGTGNITGNIENCHGVMCNATSGENYGGRIEFHFNGSSNYTSRIGEYTSGTVSCSGQLIPDANDTYRLGTSSYRWKEVWTNASAINTSDKRKKRDISYISDKVLDAWEKVEFRQFKFIDAVNEKEEKARFHIGLIAQDVDSVLSKGGVKAEEYGLYCYDKWSKQDPVVDKNTGEVLKEGLEAGDAYSIRYVEALCMEAACQRRRANKLQKQIDYMQMEIDNIKRRL